MPAITVIKNDHTGREVWRYSGRVIARGETWIQLEARFNRPDTPTSYHTFRHGDRFVEWFYTDRWYSIFEMHDADDDQLTGWYCNISRPARFKRDSSGADTVAADDLALDMFVSPAGEITILDEDEFAALPLDDQTRALARAALDELAHLVESRQPPFTLID